MARKRARASLAAPGEEGQAQAMARFAVLRPHLEESVPLTRAAREAGVPLRTTQRWLARYHRDGLAGLARTVRSDGSSLNRSYQVSKRSRLSAKGQTS